MENERTHSSSSCSLSLQSCSLNEPTNSSLMPFSSKWYWGKVQKEAVSAAMENQPNGTYCVRDASSPGDYTLTLKVGGQNKLIKIIVSNGSCGFTAETLEFNTIVQLIEYYKKHSLKDFNDRLDTCLVHPLSNPACSSGRPSPVDSPKSGRSNPDSSRDVLPVVKCRLEGLHAEYERVSKRYDQIFVQKESLMEESNRKRLTLSAYSDALNIFQKNSTMLESSSLEVTEYEKQLLKTNRDLQERRIDYISKAKQLMSIALKNLKKTINRIDEELEDLRPRLIFLHRKRDDNKEILLTKHKMSYSHIEKFLQDVSFLLDCEPSNLTSYLLSVAMVWDPHRWLTLESSKEAANRLIQSAVAHLKVEERNGVFLIRPSHSRAGCFALSISMHTQVHSCLIEYREPRKGASGQDFCGFAFLNTNMFFSTLVDFVRYYSKVSLKEHNSQLDTCLNIPALLWAGN